MQLPYEYESQFTRSAYYIVGWKGSVLQTRCGRHIWTLTRSQTLDLLSCLGLKEQDIPGYPSSQMPEHWKAWAL